MPGTRHIRDYQRVVDWFGQEPSYHDAEVIRVVLDRERHEGRDGPTLFLSIHAFTTRWNEVTASGHFRSDHHAVITFAFYDGTAIHLDLFNHQNCISGIQFKDLAPKDAHAPQLEVTIGSSYGLVAEFACRFGAVLDILPGVPRASVYGEPGTTVA